MAVLHATSLERFLSDEVIEHLVFSTSAMPNSAQPTLGNLSVPMSARARAMLCNLLVYFMPFHPWQADTHSRSCPHRGKYRRDSPQVVEAYGIEIESFLLLALPDYQGGEHQKLLLHYFVFIHFI